VSNQVKVKFRRSAALAVAAGITVIGAVPLAAESLWFLLVLLIPLAIAIWAWRAGTDVSERGFTVRALFGSRTFQWAAVDGLVTSDGKVYARLANGHLVPLDAVRPSDVPRVIKASGQPLDSDQTADTDATDGAGADTDDDHEDTPQPAK
jgi:lysylphosphatidylglycerol synthetase-like protein (DUF2156 family)